MDRIKKEMDEFEDTKKLISALTEDKLNGFNKDYLVEVSVCLTTEIKKAFQEIKKLTDEKKKLSSKLDELEKLNKPVNKYADYPKDKDYIAKLLFILSKNETAMTFEDIANAFFKLEHDLNERWRNPNKSISKIISRACKFQVIKREKVYGNVGCYGYCLLDNRLI